MNPVVRGLFIAWAIPAGVIAARLVPVGFNYWFVFMGAALLLIGVKGGSDSKAKLILFSVAFILFSAGFMRTGVNSRTYLSFPPAKVAFTGTVREKWSGGYIVDVKRTASQDVAPFAPDAVLVRTVSAANVAPGDTVEVETKLRGPSLGTGPDSASTLATMGVDAVGSSARITKLDSGSLASRLMNWVRASATATINRSLPEPQAALLLGIAFGWHQTIDTASRNALQDAGLIHVVAVSGLKVVIVAALIRSLLAVFPLRSRDQTLICLAGIAFFVVVSGGSPAAWRSGLTAAAAFAFQRDSRVPSPFVVLGLCATLMLLFDPRLLQNIGFELSFLGTAGILLLAGRVASRLPGPRFLVEPFSVTVGAQLATVPVMAASFGTISFVGPVANALALPLLPLIIGAAWTGLLTTPLLPPLSWLLMHLAGAGSAAIILIAQCCAAVPGAALHVAYWPANWVWAEGAGLLMIVLGSLTQPVSWTKSKIH